MSSFALRSTGRISRALWIVLLAAGVVLGTVALARAEECSRFAERLALGDLAPVLQSLRDTGRLPRSFVTKEQARALGWRPGADLWAHAPGKSIGGNRFGNREGRLPAGHRYYEADLDYRGGKRGAKRLVYTGSRTGPRYVTVDHYRSFVEVRCRLP